MTYFYLGEAPLAIRQYERALELRQAELGPDHPDTLTSRNNLAEAYHAAGRTAEAIALHEATLKLMESKLGPDHPDTLTSRNNLAAAYRAAGRTAEAITLHEATLKLRESKLGPDHPDTLNSRNNLAWAYEVARPLGRGRGPAPRQRWPAAARREPARQPPSGRRPRPRSAGTCCGNREWSEAEPLLRECLAIRAKAVPDDWRRFDAMSLLGGALLGQGTYAEAEPLVVARLRRDEGPRGARSRVPERSRLRRGGRAGGPALRGVGQARPGRGVEGPARPARPARRRLRPAVTGPGAVVGVEQTTGRRSDESHYIVCVLRPHPRGTARISGGKRPARRGPGPAGGEGPGLYSRRLI